MSPCERACLAGIFWGSSWSGHHWGVIERPEAHPVGVLNMEEGVGMGGCFWAVPSHAEKPRDILTAMHETGRQVLGAACLLQTRRRMAAFGFSPGARQWP